MISGFSSVALVVRLKSTSLPTSRAALPRVGDGLLQHRKVQQRLAAEEGEVGDLVVARLLQHELDALLRRLVAS